MVQRLRIRFLLAGCVLVAMAVGGSLWTAATLAQLSSTVDETIRQGQVVIELAAAIHGSLEREDDALLLFLSGQRDLARQELASERQRGNTLLAQLSDHLRPGGGEREQTRNNLEERISDYRAAGDALLQTADRNGGLETYHRLVNPRLRRAVAESMRLREGQFQAMQQAGVTVRDSARWGLRRVVVITALTMSLGVLVALWLARSVVSPIQALSRSVEAIRQGQFDSRVPVRSRDELGQLAEAFNRMAEALAEYRQSSLGELLVAKMTLEATLNALPEAVLVFDPEGTLVAVNPPGQRLLKVLACPSVGRLADIPLPKAYCDTIEAALGGTVPLGPPELSKTLNLAIEGQERRLLMRAVPIPQFVRGRYGAVAVFDDVTDFVRLDELRTELIGMASHELKSPLTSLRMNLLLLAESSAGLSDLGRELLSAAVASCEELGCTVDELLDVSRIEAGQLRLERGRVDVAAVLGTVQSRLRPRFDDAGVKLVMEEGLECVRPVLLGDATRLGSVFTNVLTNALKYSPPGSVVRVQLSTGQNAQKAYPPPLQIAVTDQGPGVPAEFRERIFEKFFRVEHYQLGGIPEVRGSGLGLYFCRQIVEAHGGRITCEPGDCGIGTRFVISLLTA